MNDNFDSRALRSTDCYGQRFMRAGTYQYNVLPTGGHLVDLDRPFVINVSDRKSDKLMNQHSVLLRFERQHFKLNQSEQVIEAGDLVIWNCPDRTAPGYVVAGDKEFFNSANLVNECGFSHAFGIAGTYEWADAHGSGLGGVIRVEEPCCKTEADLANWRAKLTKGTLVMIADGKVEPATVDIVMGQTVYFAITVSNGITITDRRLLGIGRGGSKSSGRSLTLRCTK